MTILSYNLYHHPLYAGQTKATTSKTIKSFHITDGSKFGRAVVIGDNDTSARMPKADDTEDKIVGITVREQLLPNFHGVTPFGTKSGSMSPVLTQGTIAVEVDVDVEFGQPVYVDMTVGKEGMLTNVAAGNLAIPQARFVTNTKMQNIAEIELR